MPQTTKRSKRSTTKRSRRKVRSPKTKPAQGRRNKWDDKLRAVLDELGTKKQRDPACIERGMSYSNAGSTASAIRNGKHGDGWLATSRLAEGVEPINRPGEHSEFKHYTVWVAYDEKFVGDREVF